ncbi:MAG: hypothetical protein IPP78_00960 [Holophagaceae bacterium]|nr:hypothetical protein [Holophagaceae bacterium]
MKPGIFASAALVLSLACGRVSDKEARTLVEQYNQAVCEAYRHCDVLLIDPVVAPNCVAGKNLTGLIGVRADMGIVLDAKLEELQITGVQRKKDRLEIRTQERWSYLDRRMGSGEQVGQASVDRYEVLYLFQNLKGMWMVTETRFTAPPQVGRKTMPWLMDAKEAHAMIGNEPAPGGKR